MPPIRTIPHHRTASESAVARSINYKPDPDLAEITIYIAQLCDRLNSLVLRSISHGGSHNRSDH
jgi:hypothetical protein